MWHNRFCCDHSQEDWVLCRVFYKSRGENGNNFIPRDFYDRSIAGESSPTKIENVLPHQNMVNSSFFEAQNPSSFAGRSPFHVHMHHDERNKNFVSRPSTSKCEDEYGFLFDMSLDHSYMEDVRFENDSNPILIWNVCVHVYIDSICFELIDSSSWCRFRMVIWEFVRKL